MQYDPIKDIFGRIVSKNIFLRKIFYFLLDLLFLRTWYVKREIKNLFKKSSSLKILDAGTGFGQYTYFLAKYFKDSTIKAVDIKEEQIKDCKYFFKKLGMDNVSFEYADLRKINSQNEFDLIISVDVMEHIVEDQLVFNNFSKALKIGGYLLINTPSDKGGSDVHTEGDRSFIEEHARDGYSIEDLKSKLKNSGLNIVNYKYSYGKFGRLYWLLGMKYPISLVGISKLFMIFLPFYYLITFIPIILFMVLDFYSQNNSGSGLVVIAKKL
ncbi:MAG: class I SAM-dependent methyltransferase [Ignavibacteria bacterium]|nr:class I SAM-dependent methyltransferase [Ignavibacteria bacterium]